MEIFHEIYGNSYRAIAALLEQGAKEPLTQKSMREILKKEGLEKSAYFILTSIAEQKWNLFEQKGLTFYTKTGIPPALPFTVLQAAWIQAILLDRRMGLFLDKEEIQQLQEALTPYKPLFFNEMFDYFDQFSDGDKYTDPTYLHCFRTIQKAIQQKKAVSIVYCNKKGIGQKGVFLPRRFEYSQKDDKMRVYALKPNKNKTIVILNVSRMEQAELMEEDTSQYQGDFEELVLREKSKEPIVLRISRERNAVERTMLQFASYQKETEYEEETGTYLCRIYYDKKEETELLIKALSFGPSIKVLAPKDFLRQVKERVKKQWALLQKEDFTF